ncbi:6-phosphofructo-2-kinase/fructose-2,6-bisphosphatase [Desulfonatronum sp. SC1]|uniref:bifunctional nucleoside/nucleotide kinase/histidine phosphatase family protein n=1 Tax=Desulfonatronum sp. SC1 TaxID=2109626 RepID=UPI000D32421A|nr:6-phosphofructo-2-kinase/fructose-2,6-bisphosphatase [Desulfonatronum sp. SC1]PTN38641.1 6-phosphofructokinase [Desulfonatronum sp. SC1]
MKKLCIVMVGLPARGKSTIACRLRESLEEENINVAIFNNGEIRRSMLPENTASASFFSPENQEGVRLREWIARLNLDTARQFLEEQGDIAILDATNISRERRSRICRAMERIPVLFIECVNDDEELLATSIAHKTKISEFGHMTMSEAIRNFRDRIQFYAGQYEPLDRESNHVVLNSLQNRVVQEKTSDNIPHYPRIRDILVSDMIQNLYLIRHGETYYNQERRIGGDSPLTEKGLCQAELLGGHFQTTRIPFIFTSSKRRTIQMAQPIIGAQGECKHVPLPEFDEIKSGICDSLTYDEIRERHPEIHIARSMDKYHYIYPDGEGYITLQTRIQLGIKKALYLSGSAEHIVIIGHQAVNRMILSYFLYRRQEDVPYIYIPQDKYFHIVSTQTKKLFELKRF